VGGRHLVGDPDPVAGRGVLRADGGVSAATSVIARSKATKQSMIQHAGPWIASLRSQ
jgi:hypothetical protein